MPLGDQLRAPESVDSEEVFSAPSFRGLALTAPEAALIL